LEKCAQKSVVSAHLQLDRIRRDSIAKCDFTSESKEGWPEFLHCGLARMKSAFKVLQISANFPPSICGIGDYTYLLGEALKKRGVEVHHWSGSGPDKTANRWSQLAIWRKTREIDFARFDVVHLQYEPFGFHQSYLLPILLTRIPVPLVVTFHEIFQRNRIQIIRDRRLAHASRALIVNDTGSAVKLGKLVKTGSVPIHRIGVGSNIPDLPEPRPPTSSPGGVFRLGYFGFLNAVKRIDLLIETLGRLHGLGHTHIQLRLIGDFQSSPRERSSLENLAPGLSEM
jgi:glycosyltransferase involved in cell wall biosynthesis